MELSVKTVKKLMLKELEDHYSSACQQSYDYMRKFIHNGHRYLKAELEKCQTFDELDEWLSTADYRMSLQEWIDSL